MISYSLLNLECAALVQDEMFLFSSNSFNAPIYAFIWLLYLI